MRVDPEREDIDVDGMLVMLREVISSKTVTVINLWATWCGPCKSEFVGFREMFGNRDWGDEMRFVPILVDDIENMRTAYREWGPHMPEHQVALVDLGLGKNNIRNAFIRSNLFELTESLPITILFDVSVR